MKIPEDKLFRIPDIPNEKIEEFKKQNNYTHTNYFNENQTMNQNELYHHGIKGQHWGVRNGPPYPLSSEARSVIKRTADLNNAKNRTNRIKKVGIASTVATIGAELIGAGAFVLGATNSYAAFIPLIAGMISAIAGSIGTTIYGVKETVSEVKLANGAAWIRRNIPELKDISMRDIMESSRNGSFDKEYFESEIKKAIINSNSEKETEQEIKKALESNNWGVRNRGFREVERRFDAENESNRERQIGEYNNGWDPRKRLPDSFWEGRFNAENESNRESQNGWDPRKRLPDSFWGR